MEAMRRDYGVVDKTEAVARVRSLFHGLKTDWVFPGTPDNRARWHNLKYYTWVEQQGKTVEELDRLWDPDFWTETFSQVPEWDELIKEFNRRTGLLDALD